MKWTGGSRLFPQWSTMNRKLSSFFTHLIFWLRGDFAGLFMHDFVSVKMLWNNWRESSFLDNLYGSQSHTTTRTESQIRRWWAFLTHFYLFILLWCNTNEGPFDGRKIKYSMGSSKQSTISSKRQTDMYEQWPPNNMTKRTPKVLSFGHVT